LSRATQISVIGGAEGDEATLRDAEQVGQGLAGAGAVLVCGGRGGVMEAASRGAAKAGGMVLGVLPTTDPADANPYVTHVIATGIGHARNLAVVASGDAVIAIGGEWGTLSEIGFARVIGQEVVALRSWELNGHERMAGGPGVLAVHTAAEAVAAALAAI
jgi:uncharacterized protein (TIGR00725 family)